MKNDLRRGDKNCTRNNKSDGVGQGGGLVEERGTAKERRTANNEGEANNAR